MGIPKLAARSFCMASDTDHSARTVLQVYCNRLQFCRNCRIDMFVPQAYPLLYVWQTMKLEYCSLGTLR